MWRAKTLMGWPGAGVWVGGRWHVATGKPGAPQNRMEISPWKAYLVEIGYGGQSVGRFDFPSGLPFFWVKYIDFHLSSVINTSDWTNIDFMLRSSLVL
jgi:hypothetical protein